MAVFPSSSSALAPQELIFSFSGETINLMAAVGPAEPGMTDPNESVPDGPPVELMLLGPLYVSDDCVIGSEDCARLFPPGYTEPEHKPKPKAKKKKKVTFHFYFC